MSPTKGKRGRTCATFPQPEQEAEAYAAADRFKALIFVRTQIPTHILVCPREKSDMTPCIARDGQLAVCFNSLSHTALCVGCEQSVNRLLHEEECKAT